MPDHDDIYVKRLLITTMSILVIASALFAAIFISSCQYIPAIAQGIVAAEEEFEREHKSTVNVTIDVRKETNEHDKEKAEYTGL